MDTLIKKIEQALDDKIVNRYAVGGGCIAHAQVIKTQSGQSYFLKTGFNNAMFINEANGLEELAKAHSIRIPKVIAFDTDFLVMEYIESGYKRETFFKTFGKAFAEMHQHTSDNFGFFEDNFIGSTPQMNQCDSSEAHNWPLFYFNKRLKFQYDLAEKNGHADTEFRRLFHNIENKIDSILEGSEEEPTLLHGDLWGGNYMVDDEGRPVLIDPAVYYGHREADLAMTKLFGGFDVNFYHSYNASNPLKPGYENRENIYLLYHVLNHLNIFGPSYKGQAEDLMRSYL